MEHKLLKELYDNLREKQKEEYAFMIAGGYIADQLSNILVNYKKQSEKMSDKETLEYHIMDNMDWNQSDLNGKTMRELIHIVHDKTKPPKHDDDDYDDN